MLELSPSWTWLHRAEPDRSYDNALLLEDLVLGAWFCLDRDTGREIWHRREFDLPLDRYWSDGNFEALDERSLLLSAQFGADRQFFHIPLPALVDDAAKVR